MLLSVSTRTELGTFLTTTQGMTGSLCPVQPVRKSCAGKHTVPLKIQRPWAKHCGEKNSKKRFSERCPLFVGIPSPATCLSAPPPKLFCLSAPSPSPGTCLPEAFLCFCFFFSLLASFPSLLFSYRLDNSEAFVSGGKLRWRILIWGFLSADVNGCLLLTDLQSYRSHSLLSDRSAPQRAVMTRG